MRFVSLLIDFRLFKILPANKKCYTKLNKTCSLIYFSRAEDTVHKSSLESRTPNGDQKVEKPSFQFIP